jgi:hypothetical protein
MGCALCGGPPALPWEEAHVDGDTKAKLLAHISELKTFDVTLEEYKPLRKHADVGTPLATMALALGVADSLNAGVLRRLVLFLLSLSIREEQIIRLRLDEPEKISKILRSQGPKRKAKKRSHTASRTQRKRSKG